MTLLLIGVRWVGILTLQSVLSQELMAGDTEICRVDSFTWKTNPVRYLPAEYCNIYPTLFILLIMSGCKLGEFLV